MVRSLGERGHVRYKFTPRRANAIRKRNCSPMGKNSRLLLPEVDLGDVRHDAVVVQQLQGLPECVGE